MKAVVVGAAAVVGYKPEAEAVGEHSNGVLEIIFKLKH